MSEYKRCGEEQDNLILEERWLVFKISRSIKMNLEKIRDYNIFYVICCD